MERRLSKQDLMELYGVDRITIEDWRRNKGLKMIEVSSHSKYITEKELLVWEESLKRDISVQGLNNGEDIIMKIIKWLIYSLG